MTPFSNRYPFLLQALNTYTLRLKLK